MSVPQLSKGFRPAYQFFLSTFVTASGVLAEDAITNLARKVTGAPNSKALSIGRTELKILLGKKQGALVVLLYELCKSRVETDVVDNLYGFATRLIPTGTSAPPSQRFEKQPPDSVQEAIMKEAQAAQVENSVKKELVGAESEDWREHMKLTYAYMEVMAKLQFASKGPKQLDGWTFINLLCIQEAAMGDGNMNTERLYKRICTEFPELQSRIGYKSIMQFVLHRSANDVADRLEFLKMAVYASRMIFDCVKDVKKPWPKIPDEEMG